LEAPLTAPARRAAAAADPFSVSGDAHALTGGPPAEPRPLGDVDAWHRKLCLAPSGVLYEDAHLQARRPAGPRSAALGPRRGHDGPRPRRWA